MVEFSKIRSSFDGPDTIDAGLFSYQTKGVFEGWDDEYWIANVCVNYGDLEDAGFDYEMDSKAEAVRNIAISMTVIGSVLLCWTCSAFCCPPDRRLWWFCGFSYLILSMLQGITLLVLESSLCLNNPIMQLLEAEYPSIASAYDSECDWNMGFRASISATVFWFCAGVAVFIIPSPAYPSTFGGPDGQPPAGSEDKMKEGSDNKEGTDNKEEEEVVDESESKEKKEGEKEQQEAEG